MALIKCTRFASGLAALAAAFSVATSTQALGDEPVLSISADPQVVEGEGPITVTATLDAAADSPVAFGIFLGVLEEAGDADTRVSLEDIASNRLRGQVLTAAVPAGETQVLVPIDVIDDDVVELTERMRLTLFDAAGASLGQTRALVVLKDNDAASSINILHINDHHSHLEPNSSASLLFDGVETDVETGGFPRVVAKVKALESSLDNVLTLHAGDAVTGTIFYSIFKGQADADLMNEICFDAFALGNHEFDDSDVGLAQFIGFLNADPTVCETPVLAANVRPRVGTPLHPDEDTRLIEPVAVKDVGGQAVGIIGIDIAGKTQQSSSPLDTTEFGDEARVAQLFIDQLRAQGVDRIVVLSHFQYGNELELARTLRGVDVIVGGDSHSLLGSRFTEFGLSPVGEYPTVVTNADGDAACVVQAWQFSDVVGELNVQFNSEGEVVACDGTPHLLLGDTFERDDANGDSQSLTGDDLQVVLDIIAATDELGIVVPDPAAQTLLDGYASQLDVLRETVVGIATEDLCLERIPDQGRSGIPGCQDKTRVNGGDIQQLVAEAFLQRGFEADVAIQNAGGVRIDVPAGDITIDTVFTLLPFANTLVYLDMTGAEIKQVVEEAVFQFLDQDPAGSSGSYPYAANLRWDADLSQPFGARFSNFEIRFRGTDAWVPLTDDAQVKVVTNDFIAAGRDNYLTFGVVSDEGRITDTFIDYAQAFMDYLQQNVGGASPGDPILAIPPEVAALACGDYSTQSFVNADGEPKLPTVPRSCED